MEFSPGRQRAAQWNAARRSIGALVGIAQGILADGVVETAELAYLRQWIVDNGEIATSWPGNVIYAKIQEIAADGVATQEERAHFAAVLRKLVGVDADDLAETLRPTRLGLDDVDRVEFAGSTFCFTGDFVFGPRATCEEFTQRRGGIVQAGITKKLRYLIVGGLGSIEWRGVSFGNKIMKAQQYKVAGVPILIVHEDIWSNSMNGGGKSMSMKNAFRAVCLIAPIALAGCGNQDAAEKAVRNVLNDPNSAIFSGVKSGAEKGSVCGQVNAKNRMGGYVGATPFFYRSSGQVAILSAPTESEFRMLWLRMKLPGVSNDDIRNDIGELMFKCRAIAQWKTVCGSEPPVSAPSLCAKMLPGSDGEDLYHALKNEFDTN